MQETGDCLRSGERVTRDGDIRAGEGVQPTPAFPDNAVLQKGLG